MDKACEDSVPIFVQRRNSQNVVIISEDEYLKMDETAYLFASPKNKNHLKKSLQELKNKATKSVDIDQLWK